MEVVGTCGKRVFAEHDSAVHTGTHSNPNYILKTYAQPNQSESQHGQTEGSQSPAPGWGVINH